MVDRAFVRIREGLTHDRHDIGARLPRMKHPVMCVAKEADPNIVELDNAASKIPGVKKARIARDAGVGETARLLNEFLDA